LLLPCLNCASGVATWMLVHDSVLFFVYSYTDQRRPPSLQGYQGRMGSTPVTGTPPDKRLAPSPSACLTANDVLGVHVSEPASFASYIAMLAGGLASRGRIRNAASFTSEVMSRECQRSSRLPNGVASPHLRSSEVLLPSLAVATVGGDPLARGNAAEPIELVLLLAMPPEAADLHLRAWERLALRAAHASFREACAACESEGKLERLVAAYIC